jgi:hypothetical protein
MVEGGSSEDFARVKGLFYEDRAAFDLLLGKLTESLIAYFKMQIQAGADAIQIFDSWGGIIAGPDYEAASLRWIRAIIAAMPEGFPIIIYGKGTGPAPDGPGVHRGAGAERGLDERPLRRAPQPARQRRGPGQPGPGHPEHHARHRAEGNLPHP